LAGDSKIPNAVIDAIIKQVDENGDGQISLEEFTHLMRNASL
jgi:Ca2+-binding EF-hand superfamily protein